MRIFTHTDNDNQGIDVYFIDQKIGITLPDKDDDQSGPIVWLAAEQADRIAKSIITVSYLLKAAEVNK
jgi:hypothetical protein